LTATSTVAVNATIAASGRPRDAAAELVSTSLLAANANTAVNSQPKDAAAILAAYLGEVPAPAALRRPSPAGGGVNAVRAAREDVGATRSGSGSGKRHRQGRREADDSPPDTPDTRMQANFSSFDDDRPPTPSPAEFATEAAYLPPNQQVEPQKSETSAAKSKVRRETETRRLPSAEPPQRIGQPAPPPLPPERVSPMSTRSFASLGGSGEDCIRSAPLPPALPLRPLRQAPRPSANLPLSSTDKPPGIPLDVSRRTSGRKSSATCRSLPPPVSGDTLADGEHFFVEGVGWCDLFGRQVDDQLDNRAGEVTMLPTRANVRSKPRARSKPPRSKEHQPAKLSARERNLNWDAIGGI
jgi:hypothetical protein